MKVRRSAPWGAEEDDIHGPSSLLRLTPLRQCLRKLDKIPEHEFDPVGNAVDGRVVSRESQPRLVVVDRNNVLACLGKRDCVPANPAKRVYDGVATTSLRDLVRNEFRGYAVPANAIQKTALIIEREVSVPLREI